MQKLTLSPEDLRVDSFPTAAAGASRLGTVHGHGTTLPRTRPECAATVYDTCDCLEELMARAVVTTRPLRTCPECANTGPYATCE